MLTKSLYCCILNQIIMKGGGHVSEVSYSELHLHCRHCPLLFAKKSINVGKLQRETNFILIHGKKCNFYFGPDPTFTNFEFREGGAEAGPGHVFCGKCFNVVH